MHYDRLKQRVKAATAQRQKAAEARRLLESLDITQHMAQVYFPLHADIQARTHSTFNLPGGRGSAKSSFVSLEIVKGVMDDPTGQSNAIIFRLIGGTLRDSCYSQISWAIDTLGVSHLWRGGVSPMQYTYLPTGAQILFRGLDDASKLKSIKPRRGVFKFCWFEEFSELHGPNFARNVLQSVQRGGDHMILFRTFNPPISKNAWANTFIQEPDERAVTLHTDYTMIPPEWLGEAFIYEAQRLQTLNPVAYRHEYMGEAVGTGGEVFQNLEVREITQDEIDQMGYIFQGLDFGFAADPLAFIRAGYDRKSETIYLLDEIYKRGMSNQAIAEEIKERGYHISGNSYKTALFGEVVTEKQRITCDCAEPKSISDLRNLGINAGACYKSPGCVQYRIKWLQCRRIVIDPKRTPNAHREFTAYSYATDKDGVVLSELPDRDNHTIDALAYSLDRQIYTGKNPA